MKKNYRNAPAVMTVSEAALRLGISGQRVRRLIRKGLLTAINIGSRERQYFRLPVAGVSEYQKQKKRARR
jgi:excisionase family DNA binding protein